MTNGKEAREAPPPAPEEQGPEAAEPAQGSPEEREANKKRADLAAKVDRTAVEAGPGSEIDRMPSEETSAPPQSKEETDSAESSPEKTTSHETPSSFAPEGDNSEKPKGRFGQAMETITGFFAGAGSKTMEGLGSAMEGIGRAYEAFQNFVAQTMAPLLESLEGSESGLAKGLRDFLYMVSGKNRVAFFQQMNAYEVTFQNLEISKFISIYKRRSNEEAHPVPFEKFCAAVMKEFKGKDVAFSDFLKKAEDPQEVPWPGVPQVPEQQPSQAQPPAAPEGTSANAPQTSADQAPAEGADGAQRGGQGGSGGASQDV